MDFHEVDVHLAVGEHSLGVALTGNRRNLVEGDA